MKNYTDARLLDTANAVRRLPELHPERHGQQQKATGTYDDQGVVVGVVLNMRGDDGNAGNAESRDSVQIPIKVCNSSACGNILNTSIRQENGGGGNRTRVP